MGRGQSLAVLVGSQERCWAFAFLLGIFVICFPGVVLGGRGEVLLGEMKDEASSTRFPSLRFPPSRTFLKIFPSPVFETCRKEKKQSVKQY